METPAFARVQERKEISAVPLRDLLAAQPKRLLLGMGTRFIEGFTFNFFSVFLLAYVVTNLELPKSLGARTGSWSARRWASCWCRSPARCRTGWVASRSSGSAPGSRCCSRSRWPRWCRARAGWAIFVASWPGSGLVYGVVYGPLAAFWSELFDTRYRYTALSSLYQISGIVASGLTPLIAAWLVTAGRRHALVGGGLQRGRRRDQPGLRPAAARDPGPRPGRRLGAGRAERVPEPAAA